MSFLGRLFGRTPPEPAAAELATTSVVIDPALATALTAGGETLAVAVDQALRAQLAAQSRPAAEAPDRVPFWLQRDEERSAELEDELRDRVIQRHESEDDSRQ